jgi:hypothetical protein
VSILPLDTTAHDSGHPWKLSLWSHSHMQTSLDVCDDLGFVDRDKLFSVPSAGFLCVICVEPSVCRPPYLCHRRSLLAASYLLLHRRCQADVRRQGPCRPRPQIPHLSTRPLLRFPVLSCSRSRSRLRVGLHSMRLSGHLPCNTHSSPVGWTATQAVCSRKWSSARTRTL